MLGWSIPMSPNGHARAADGRRVARLGALSGAALGAATGAGKLGDGSEGKALGGDAAGRSL